MTDVPFEVDGKVNFRGLIKLLLPSEPSKAGAWVTVSCDNGLTLKAKGDETMAYTLPAGMKVGLKVSYVDAGGNPAKVDGDPRWDESDSSIIVVQAKPGDPFAVTLHAVGPLGQAQVSVHADADLGDGVKPL